MLCTIFNHKQGRRCISAKNYDSPIDVMTFVIKFFSIVSLIAWKNGVRGFICLARAHRIETGFSLITGKGKIFPLQA